MYTPRPDHDPWSEPVEPVDEPRLGSKGYFVILLVLLAIIVLCLTGFFVARILRSDSRPVALPGLSTTGPSLTTPDPNRTGQTGQTGEPGELQIDIQPQQGYINTLINVTGQGCWPGEPVFIFLRSPGEAEGEGYAYAAAVADDDGRFRAAFTFPNERRWTGQTWAEVIAQGSRSGMSGSARFDLVAPTATATQPVPTAGPTPLPTETVTPTATLPPTDTPPAETVITDWRGEYFANITLGGDPVIVRNDVAVDFNWGADSPDARLPSDQFSARWTRRIDFLEGYYRFIVSADDGLRLWLDGQLLVDEWQDGMLEEYEVTVSLSGGSHGLRVEYYENLGGAMVQVRWRQVELLTATPTSSPTVSPTPMPTVTATPSDMPVPSATPTATDTPPQPPPQALPGVWQGEYFANARLEGSPVLVRQDARVYFDWQAGSPADGVPADGFSVRWTGEQWMPAGSYYYSLLVDDGARIWIDGNLVLDAWRPAPGRLHRAAIQLTEGIHTFRVEYHEMMLNALIQLEGQAGGR
jgi:hypothetical protein